MQHDDQKFVCDKRDHNITCVICHGLLQSSGVLQKDLYKHTVSIVCICKVCHLLFSAI